MGNTYFHPPKRSTETDWRDPGSLFDGWNPVKYVTRWWFQWSMSFRCSTLIGESSHFDSRFCFFLQMSWNHQLDKVHTVNSSDWGLGHWDGHGQGIFWTVFVFNNGSTPLTARQTHTFWWEPSSTDIVNRLSCKTLHFGFQCFCGSTNHMSWFWHLTYTLTHFFSKQFPPNKKNMFFVVARNSECNIKCDI